MSSRFDTAEFMSADGDDAAVLTIKRDHTNGLVLMRIGEDGAIFVATEETARIVGGFIRHGDPVPDHANGGQS